VIGIAKVVVKFKAYSFICYDYIVPELWIYLNRNYSFFNKILLRVWTDDYLLVWYLLFSWNESTSDNLTKWRHPGKWRKLLHRTVCLISGVLALPHMPRLWQSYYFSRITIITSYHNIESSLTCAHLGCHGNVFECGIVM